VSTDKISLNKKKLSRLIAALEARGTKKYGRGKKVAEVTGYSEARVSEMLSGKLELAPKFVAILCAKFSISEDWVASGEGEMFSETSAGAAQLQEEAADEIARLGTELRKEKEKLSTAEFYRVMAGLYGVIEDMKKEREGSK
jgi:transcriptional regulator with XRE-family HTH domain